MVRIPTLIPCSFVEAGRDAWRVAFRESSSPLDTAYRIFILILVAAGLAAAAALSSVSIVFTVIFLTVAFMISDRLVTGTITDLLEKNFYVLEVDIL